MGPSYKHKTCIIYSTKQIKESKGNLMLDTWKEVESNHYLEWRKERKHVSVEVGKLLDSTWNYSYNLSSISEKKKTYPKKEKGGGQKESNELWSTTWATFSTAKQITNSDQLKTIFLEIS